MIVSIRVEDNAIVADIPNMGSTYCSIDENIISYVVDYIRCSGVEVRGGRWIDEWRIEVE